MCLLLGGFELEPAFIFIQEHLDKYFYFEDIDVYTISEKKRISKAQYFMEEQGFE